MQSYRNTKVFISGGAGVIGTALVDQLHREGAKLFVGDLKPRPKQWPSDIIYRQGDLNDAVKEELLAFEPEFFFHLAATFERSEETYEFWEENFHHNVQLSHHLLNCFKDCRSLKRVIFASSYLIYDPTQYLFPDPSSKPVKLSESSSLNPRNLCGMAKFLHEKELAFIQGFRGKSLSAVSARIFRGYGRGSKDVISRWIGALLKGEEIAVFAKEGMFDFIFADDTALGLKILGKISFSGQVNLGTGQSRRIVEILDLLKDHFPKMKIGENALRIPYEASEADMSTFQKLTGWLPSISIEKGIPLIIEHLRSESK